jgi:LPS export ABC transporter protein LptC
MNFNKKRYRYYILLSKGTMGVIISIIILGLIYEILRTQPNHTESDEKSMHHDKYGITITNTVLEGSDHEGRSYNISSKTTHKSDDGMYYMQDIDGKYDLGVGQLSMTSRFGTMDDVHQILKLKDNAAMSYDGYLLRANQLDVDLKNRASKGDSGVTVLHAGSLITADSFDASSETNTIRFTGHVTTHLKFVDF